MNEVDYFSVSPLLKFGLGYSYAKGFVESESALSENYDFPEARGVISKEIIESFFHYVIIDGKVRGPYTLIDMARMANEGLITKDSLLWRPDLFGWVKAEYFGSLITAIAVCPPPFEED